MSGLNSLALGVGGRAELAKPPQHRVSELVQRDCTRLLRVEVEEQVLHLQLCEGTAPVSGTEVRSMRTLAPSFGAHPTAAG